MDCTTELADRPATGGSTAAAVRAVEAPTLHTRRIHRPFTGLEEKLGKLAPDHAVAGSTARYFVERTLYKVCVDGSASDYLCLTCHASNELVQLYQLSRWAKSQREQTR